MQYDRIANTKISRRRLTQGLAASPLALSGLGLGAARVAAQDPTNIKFWTQNPPPQVDQK
jgi:hypothetical protein